MTDENRTTNARAEIQAARDALRVAEAAFGLGVLRDATSRAYYAVFHAVRALLLLDGLQAKTHGGLLRLLDQRLVKTGKLEERWNGVVAELLALRQASDYAFIFVLPAANVAARVQSARELVDLADATVKAAGG